MLAARCQPQLHLCSPAPCQTRERAFAPYDLLGQLLLDDGVGALLLVEPPEESRGGHLAAPFVEGPADERAVLVVIQLDRRGGFEGDAVLGCLDNAYIHLCRKDERGS